MMRPELRRALIKRAIGYPAVLLFAVALLWIVSIRVPGKTWSGPLPPLTAAEGRCRRERETQVQMLAGTIGERSERRMAAYDSAARYIEATFQRLGYTVTSQPHVARGRTYRNLEITIPGQRIPAEILLIGAHYDAVEGTPGADDNASGTASLIELARLLRDHKLDRTVRFVAFANEEPPFFFTEDMGSRRYARMAKERNDDITAMLSRETRGY
jgi:Zn-dependent M28 family amino/carboxypeptidase